MRASIVPDVSTDVPTFVDDHIPCAWTTQLVCVLREFPDIHDAPIELRHTLLHFFNQDGAVIKVCG